MARQIKPTAKYILIAAIVLGGFFVVKTFVLDKQKTTETEAVVKDSATVSKDSVKVDTGKPSTRQPVVRLQETAKESAPARKAVAKAVKEEKEPTTKKVQEKKPVKKTDGRENLDISNL